MNDDRVVISADLERCLQVRAKYPGAYGNPYDSYVAGAIADGMGWNTWDNQAAEEVLTAMVAPLEDIIREHPPKGREDRGRRIANEALADFDTDELYDAVIGFGLGRCGIDGTVDSLGDTLRDILVARFTTPLCRMLERWERDTLGPRRGLTPRQRRLQDR